MHTCEEACKRGVHTGFKILGRHYPKSKTGLSVSGPTKKTDVLQKFILRKGKEIGKYNLSKPGKPDGTTLNCVTVYNPHGFPRICVIVHYCHYISSVFVISTRTALFSSV